MFFQALLSLFFFSSHVICLFFYKKFDYFTLNLFKINHDSLSLETWIKVLSVSEKHFRSCLDTWFWKSSNFKIPQQMKIEGLKLNVRRQLFIFLLFYQRNLQEFCLRFSFFIQSFILILILNPICFWVSKYFKKIKFSFLFFKLNFF